jgi:phytoene/squalene synthetase
MRTLRPPSGITGAALAEALAVSEGIASKDSSNLYLTSQFFKDRARYYAFVAMYAVMRVIDDLVDDVPDKARLSEGARERLLRELDDWEARIREAYAGAPRRDPIDVSLAAAVQTFPVPLGLWLAFVDAMRFDVRKSRFEDFEEFVRYGEGATVAATSMYVYLLTSQRQPDGRYVVVEFDYLTCGRALGLSAYIAHVLRDVGVDLEVGETGLLYLSTADLQAHRLTEADLRALAAGSAPDATRVRWRAIVREICARARVIRAEGAAMAGEAWSSLPPDRGFIFRLIVELYAELLDRIDADPDRVFGPEPVLTDAERSALLRSAADAAGYRLPRRAVRIATDV